MRHVRLLAGVALALTSAWAIAQDAPESLLPPGFDQPAQRPATPPSPKPPPQARQTPSRLPAPAVASSPVVQQLPGLPNAPVQPGQPAQLTATGKPLPTLDQLEKMSPDEIEEALGLKPKSDIPDNLRHSARQVGVIGEEEGGMAPGLLAGQDPSLIRAALAGNSGRLISRWGHILLRRALASRLDAPAGMNPADFVALRVALLLRMGEADAARELAQGMDTGDYTPALTNAAFDSYVATADFTGICPAMLTQGDTRTDPQWQAACDICRAFRGDSSGALADLDHALYYGKMPKIDLLLAQRYAGAAGKVRRAVNIEWDDVDEMTPWRYGLAIAVGLQPPASLMENAGPHYDEIAALAPMLGVTTRAAAADIAAGEGILSSAAMVDLYGQVYANTDTDDEWAQRAEQLRDAYVAQSPSARLSAMQQLWNGASTPETRYSRLVLTAYAAARLPVDPNAAKAAPDLIASMLTAGLDSNALRWANAVKSGSLGWALLALVDPSPSSRVSGGAIDSFVDDNKADGSRKATFLVAGLAGLDRISAGAADKYAKSLGFDLHRQSRWSRMIDKAANLDNQALVALLAGVGMQGDSWAKMTPRYLYHIVSALEKVGLDGEARMIAAEAVARG
jgi:hypothetical protein